MGLLIIAALLGLPVLGLLWDMIKAAFSVVFVVIFIVGCVIALCCGTQNNNHYQQTYTQRGK